MKIKTLLCILSAIVLYCANPYCCNAIDSDSIEYAKRQANQGDAQAQFVLGGLYETGNGVRQDCDEAVKWIRKSANQGYAKAQFYLGVMYGTGRCVRQSNSEAMQWVIKACQNGNQDACDQYERMKR